MAQSVLTDLKTTEPEPPPAIDAYALPLKKQVRIRKPFVLAIIPEYKPNNSIEHTQRNSRNIVRAICRLLGVKMGLMLDGFMTPDDMAKKCADLIELLKVNKEGYDALLLIIHAHGIQWKNVQYIAVGTSWISLPSILKAFSWTEGKFDDCPKLLITGVCAGPKENIMKREYSQNRDIPRRANEKYDGTKEPKPQFWIHGFNENRIEEFNLSRSQEYISKWTILRASHYGVSTVITLTTGTIRCPIRRQVTTAPLFAFLFALKWHVQTYNNNNRISSLNDSFVSLSLSSTRNHNNPRFLSAFNMDTNITQLFDDAVPISQCLNKMKHIINSANVTKFGGVEIILEHVRPNDVDEIMKSVLPDFENEMKIHENDLMSAASILRFAGDKSTVRYGDEFQQTHLNQFEQAKKINGLTQIQEGEIKLSFIEFNVSSYISTNSLSQIFLNSAKDYHRKNNSQYPEYKANITHFRGIKRAHINDISNILAHALKMNAINGYYSFNQYFKMMRIWLQIWLPMMAKYPYVLSKIFHVFND